MKKITALLITLSLQAFAQNVETTGSGPDSSPEKTSMVAMCWQKMVKGRDHSIAIKSDGSLWTWGSNTLGQLGDGTNTDRLIPTQIGNAGSWQTMSAGGDHSLAVKNNGTLWAWGSNSSGQLGDGTTVSFRNTPVQVGTLANWKAVAASESFSIAIKTDGTLWGWGSNNYNQLGSGSFEPSNVPVQIGTDTNWSKIAVGLYFTLAIKTDGTLWGWGRNSVGQLGDATLTDRNQPVQIGTANNWVSISAGQEHSVGVKSNGTLWTWGEGFLGRLGHGSFDDKSIPTQVGTATNWASAVAGDQHTIALKTNGTIWGFGYNQWSQLGNGGAGIDTSIPNQIGTGTTWQSVAAGTNHSGGIKTDASLWGWGANYGGQIGNGLTAGSNVPTDVGCFTTVLSTEGFTNATSAKLYPNPVENVIHLSSASAIIAASVYDVLGQQVIREEIGATEASIDVSMLRAGTYFVLLNAAEGSHTFKIIKK